MKEAPRPELVVWFGHAESANLTRTPIAERVPYNDVGVLFAAAHASTRFTGRINSNLEFRSYSLDGLDDETLGRLDGLADFNLAGDVFHWRFRETYDQGRTDAFAAFGPDNRQNINVFSTGPQLDLPVGPRTNLSLGGDYSERRYQDSRLVDSNSVAYNFGVLREIGGTTQVGVIATTNEIDYVDATIARYKVDTLSLRYDKTLATGRALLEWGSNELSTPVFSEHEPFFNVAWFRKITARSTLSIGASRQFTDSGGLATPTLSDAPPAAQSDILVSAAPLDRKGFNVGYTIAAPRTNVSVRLADTKDGYVGGSTLNNDTLTVSLGISHSVSTRLRFGFGLDNITREFTDTVTARGDDKDETLTAWVDRALNSRFSVSLVLSRYDRRGAGSFDENRYEVRLNYSPNGNASAALPAAGR